MLPLNWESLKKECAALPALLIYEQLAPSEYEENWLITWKLKESELQGNINVVVKMKVRYFHGG
jgi:hypothetical protein